MRLAPTRSSLWEGWGCASPAYCPSYGPDERERGWLYCLSDLFLAKFLLRYTLVPPLSCFQLDRNPLGPLARLLDNGPIQCQ